MRLALALLAILAAGPARTDGEPAGDFDYWVLALTWAPSWCARQGAARGSPVCKGETRWSVHGLWPQYERGWPAYCRGGARDPDRGELAMLADLVGGPDAARHQWRKHGRCSGLDPADYTMLLTLVLDRIILPPEFAALDRAIALPASVVEAAFLAANPDLAPDATVTFCRGGRIEEVRVCLDRSLAPRNCARDIRADCSLDSARMAPPG